MTTREAMIEELREKRQEAIDTVVRAIEYYRGLEFVRVNDNKITVKRGDTTFHIVVSTARRQA